VLIFTPGGKMLVQQRSKTKSQSPLLLDCSVSEHLVSGETYYDAAVRGLKEEIGLTGVAIEPIIKFRMNYGVNDNEISMIFKGVAGPDLVRFDPDEIEKVDYFDVQELERLMTDQPAVFSYWFFQILLWYLDKPSDLILMESASDK
jgi:isopentenyldiphosphate isomerase